jgi:exosome complex component RRP42
MLRLSKSESLYIEEGIKQDVRNDGRQKLDFRPFKLETKLIVQSNGSARVKLGNTDVLVGVKVELGEPAVDAPHLGMVDVKVEWYTAVSLKFIAPHLLAPNLVALVVKI